MLIFASIKSSSNFHDAVKAGRPANDRERHILRAGVQPKLKIGAVNDPAKVEADRVAGQVMRIAAPGRSPEPSSTSPKISIGNKDDMAHRECAKCDDGDKVICKENLCLILSSELT